MIDLLDSSKNSDGEFKVDWMNEFKQSSHYRRFVEDRLTKSSDAFIMMLDKIGKVLLFSMTF